MRLIIFLIALLIFTNQVDYYDIAVKDSIVSIDFEDNNTFSEEYIIYVSKQFRPQILLIAKSKISSSQSFESQIHQENEIDPPEYLS